MEDILKTIADRIMEELNEFIDDPLDEDEKEEFYNFIINVMESELNHFE